MPGKSGENRGKEIMASNTRKVGSNRGAKRVWLEGKILGQAGWTAKKTRFDITQSVHGLTLVRSDNGARRVSGKGDKPIIDICGATLGVVQDFERVEIVATFDAIEITQAKG